MPNNDPLAQLRDIHLPEAVSWWPLAVGWWILLVLFLAIVATSIYLVLAKRRRNRYRLAALAELQLLWSEYQNHADTEMYVAKLAQLVRRTAITAYPKSNAATLFGEVWLQFLDQTATGDNFCRGAGKLLATLPYQDLSNKSKLDLNPLHTCVASWVQTHRRSKSKGVEFKATDNNGADYVAV